MKRTMTMREALDDPDTFATILPGESWERWRVLLIASQGEELTNAERAILHELTGREREPSEMCAEVWGVIGRRGGKTRAFAVAASYFAACCEWDDVLAPGERAILPILAASTWQASKALSYVRGVFTKVPRLSAMIDSMTAETISLHDPVDIEVRPANMNTIRSGTAIAAVADEVAFWKSDRSSKNPDHEILDALRPSLLTTGGPLFVMSSPHARKGELYKTFRRDFGPNGDPLVLVARAASKTMNPSLPQRDIDRAYVRDRSKAKAEFGAEFREDIEDYVSPETLEALTSKGVRHRPRQSGMIYTAFVDPSGGRKDAMTLAISHKERGKSVLDAIEVAEPPFSPEEITKQFCALLKSYGIYKVTGDRYGGEWPVERFRVHGISYQLTEMSRSEIYLAFLPLINSGEIELLDVGILRDQLSSLERRTSKGARDAINHPDGEHDDVANAVAGAMVATASRPLSLMDCL